jgi:hypothetical protein
MKYISLAAHNNELIVISDMDAFTTHFCYSKKQRQGKIDLLAPVPEKTDETDSLVPGLEAEELEISDEDDL